MKLFGTPGLKNIISSCRWKYTEEMNIPDLMLVVPSFVIGKMPLQKQDNVRRREKKKKEKH